MARVKVTNVPAIVKAYQAEAKRAERNAKTVTGDLFDYWQSYAGKCRAQAMEASRQPSTVEAEPVTAPCLPVDQAAWRDRLLQLDAADRLRFAEARAEGVTI